MQVLQYCVIVLSIVTPISVRATLTDPSSEALANGQPMIMFSKRGLGNLRHRHGYKSGEPAYRRLSENSPSLPPAATPQLTRSLSQSQLANRGRKSERRVSTGASSEDVSTPPSRSRSPVPRSRSSLPSEVQSVSRSSSGLSSFTSSRSSSPALSRSGSASLDKHEPSPQAGAVRLIRQKFESLAKGKSARASILAQGSPDRPFNAYTRTSGPKNHHIGTHLGDKPFVVKDKQKASAGGSSPANGHLEVSAHGQSTQVKIRVKEGGEGYVRSVYDGKIRETRHYTQAHGKQRLNFRPSGSGENMEVIAGIHGKGEVAVQGKV